MRNGYQFCILYRNVFGPNSLDIVVTITTLTEIGTTNRLNINYNGFYIITHLTIKPSVIMPDNFF